MLETKQSLDNQKLQSGLSPELVELKDLLGPSENLGNNQCLGMTQLVVNSHLICIALCGLSVTYSFT